LNEAPLVVEEEATPKVTAFSFLANSPSPSPAVSGLLPTVLLGETSRYLGGGAATTVGATAVGPSIMTLREHPELVDRAAAQGRAMYCWTVDHYEDVEFCRDIGVGWIATNHPGRTKTWLQNGLSGAGRD
jgi:glycerophosphoryl diester phosphodiesterase